jgi:hypothetical protein
MFFTECANLAERHPELAGTIQRIDEQLQDMGTAEVLRVADFASFLGVDPNQVTSVFEMLAQDDLLVRENMVECPHCAMAVLRSEYEDALEEDGEFRCTSCDHPLPEAAVQAITTYRRGEKWEDVPIPRETSVTDDGASAGITHDDQAWYTHNHLAEVFKLGKDALRKRLEKYRKGSLDGWKENEDRRPREPKYIYQLCRIKHIITEMQTSSERPAK